MRDLLVLALTTRIEDAVGVHIRPDDVPWCGIREHGVGLQRRVTRLHAACLHDDVAVGPISCGRSSRQLDRVRQRVEVFTVERLELPTHLAVVQLLPHARLVQVGTVVNDLDFAVRRRDIEQSQRCPVLVDDLDLTLLRARLNLDVLGLQNF